MKVEYLANQKPIHAFRVLMAAKVRVGLCDVNKEVDIFLGSWWILGE